MSSRCYACNHILTPTEMTRRFKQSQTFTELCNSCLDTIDEETVDSEYTHEDYSEKETDEE